MSVIWVYMWIRQHKICWQLKEYCFCANLIIFLAKRPPCKGNSESESRSNILQSVYFMHFCQFLGVHLSIRHQAQGKIFKSHWLLVKSLLFWVPWTLAAGVELGLKTDQISYRVFMACIHSSFLFHLWIKC